MRRDVRVAARLLRPWAIATALLLTVATTSAAQSSVLVVRHAERADTANGAAPVAGSDPDLSAAGLARAGSLAAALKDAGIAAIFVTEFKRTQQTAAPLAGALGLTATIVPSKDLAALVEKIGKVQGNVLVVGHSNTVPGVIKALGVDAAPQIADGDYDDLFIVHRGEKPSLVRLHYR